MVIPGPQIPKPARPLSPAEREDSIQKRQRPTEVNTVLAIAGGDSRIEISTLTKDQKALLWWKWQTDHSRNKFSLSARWVSKQRLDGSYKVRLVARGFEQTVSSEFMEIQLLSETVTVHFINHRCQSNQSRCMWN